MNVFKAVRHHGCMKLQCLSQEIMAETGRAHRALDDTVSLRQVAMYMAQSLDVSLLDLMKPFALAVDVNASLAQLSFLMDAT